MQDYQVHQATLPLQHARFSVASVSQPDNCCIRGINDGAECQPNRRILDFTLRGPKVKQVVKLNIHRN